MAELLMRAAAQVGMSSVVAEGWGTVIPAGVARGDCDTAAAGLWVGGWQLCTPQPQPQPGRAPSLALQPGTRLLCVLCEHPGLPAGAFLPKVLREWSAPMRHGHLDAHLSSASASGGSPGAGHGAAPSAPSSGKRCAAARSGSGAPGTRSPSQPNSRSRPAGSGDGW